MNLQQVSALVSCLKYVWLKKGNKKTTDFSAQKMDDILSLVIAHQDEQVWIFLSNGRCFCDVSICGAIPTFLLVPFQHICLCRLHLESQGCL